jgi:hypothetical protein
MIRHLYDIQSEGNRMHIGLPYSEKEALKWIRTAGITLSPKRIGIVITVTI